MADSTFRLAIGPLAKLVFPDNVNKGTNYVFLGSTVLGGFSRLFQDNLPFLLRAYAYDFFGALVAYSFISSRKSPKSTAAFASFMAGSFIELGQKYGLFQGTYDPYDFLAYAAGVGTGLLVDAAISRRTKRSLESKLD